MNNATLFVDVRSYRLIQSMTSNKISSNGNDELTTQDLHSTIHKMWVHRRTHRVKKDRDLLRLVFGQ